MNNTPPRADICDLTAFQRKCVLCGALIQNAVTAQYCDECRTLRSHWNSVKRCLYVVGKHLDLGYAEKLRAEMFKEANSLPAERRRDKKGRFV